MENKNRQNGNFFFRTFNKALQEQVNSKKNLYLYFLKSLFTDEVNLVSHTSKG